METRHCLAAVVLIIFVTDINSAPQSYHKLSHKKHEEKTEEVYSGGITPHISHSPLVQSYQSTSLGNSYDMHSTDDSMFDQQHQAFGSNSFNNRYHNIHKTIQPPDNVAYTSYYAQSSPTVLVKAEQPYLGSTKSQSDQFKEKEISFGSNNNFSETFVNQNSRNNNNDYQIVQNPMKLIMVPEHNAPFSNANTAQYYQNTKSSQPTHYEQKTTQYNREQSVVRDSSHLGTPTVASTFVIKPQIDQTTLFNHNSDISDRKQYGYVASTQEESYKNSNGDGWTKKTHKYQPVGSDQNTNGLLKTYSTFTTTGSGTQSNLENNKNTDILITPGIIQSESRQLHIEEPKPNFGAKFEPIPSQPIATFDHKIEPSLSSWSSWSSWSAWSSGPTGHSTERRQRIETASMKKPEPFIDSSKTDTTRNVYSLNTYLENQKQPQLIDTSNTNLHSQINPSFINHHQSSGSPTTTLWPSGSNVPDHIHPEIANKRIESASLRREDAFIESLTEFSPTNMQIGHLQNKFIETPQSYKTIISQPAIQSVKTSKSEHNENVQYSYNSNKPKTDELSIGNHGLGIINNKNQLTVVSGVPFEHENSQNSNIKFEYQKQILPNINEENRPIMKGNSKDSHQIQIEKSETFTKSGGKVETERDDLLGRPTLSTFIENEKDLGISTLHTQNNLNAKGVFEDTSVINPLSIVKGKKYTSIKKEVHNSTEVIESHSDDYQSEKTSKKSETMIHHLSSGVDNPQNQHYKFNEHEYLQSHFGPQKNLEIVEKTNVNPVLDNSYINRHKQLSTKESILSEYGRNDNRGDDSSQIHTKNNNGQFELQSQSFHTLQKTDHELEMKQKLEEMTKKMLEEMKNQQGYKMSHNISPVSNFADNGKIHQSQQYVENHSSQTYVQPSSYFQTQSMQLHQEPEPCPYEEDAGKSFGVHQRANNFKSYEQQRYYQSGSLQNPSRYKRNIRSFLTNDANSQLSNNKKLGYQESDFLEQQEAAKNYEQQFENQQGNQNFEDQLNNQQVHEDFAPQNNYGAQHYGEFENQQANQNFEDQLNNQQVHEDFAPQNSYGAQHYGKFENQQANQNFEDQLNNQQIHEDFAPQNSYGAQQIENIDSKRIHIDTSNDYSQKYQKHGNQQTIDDFTQETQDIQQHNKDDFYTTNNRNDNSNSFKLEQTENLDLLNGYKELMKDFTEEEEISALNSANQTEKPVENTDGYKEENRPEYTEEEYRQLLKELNEVMSTMNSTDQTLDELFKILDNNNNSQVPKNPLENEFDKKPNEGNQLSQKNENLTQNTNFNLNQETQTAKIFEFGQEPPKLVIDVSTYSPTYDLNQQQTLNNFDQQGNVNIDFEFNSNAEADKRFIEQETSNLKREMEEENQKNKNNFPQNNNGNFSQQIQTNFYTGTELNQAHKNNEQQTHQIFELDNKQQPNEDFGQQENGHNEFQFGSQIGCSDIERPEKLKTVSNSDYNLHQDNEFGHANHQQEHSFPNQGKDTDLTSQKSDRQNDVEYNQNNHFDHQYQFNFGQGNSDLNQIEFGQETDQNSQSINDFQRKSNGVSDGTTTQHSIDDKDQYSHVFDNVNENDSTEMKTTTESMSESNNKDKQQGNTSNGSNVFTEEEYRKIINKFNTMFDFKNALNNIKQKLGYNNNNNNNNETHNKLNNDETNNGNNKSAKSGNTPTTNESKENSNESNSKETIDKHDKNSESNENEDNFQTTGTTSIWGHLRDKVTNTYTSAKGKIKEVAGQVRDKFN